MSSLVKEKVIIPLDDVTKDQALRIASELQGLVWGFKVNDLLLTEGVSIIQALKQFGRVFADPKLHDIPNTVGNGVQRLSEAGADLITIHASGGRRMIEAAVKSSGDSKILAVTALTSLSETDTREVFSKSPEDTVLNFAKLAADSGAHGIVCSPKELPLIKSLSLIKLTPGVRPSWYETGDDQSRTMTPKEAVALGSTYLVIGRPIMNHPKGPREALKLVEAELCG